MGVCSSAMTPEEESARRNNRAVDTTLKQSRVEEEQKIKLLLLGAGESGKTTIFKQMKILYGKGISDKDRRRAAEVVYTNVVSTMKLLLDQSRRLGKYEAIEARKEADEVIALPELGGVVVDADLAGKLATLWADPGVQATWQLRQEFQIVESVAAFFADLERIGAEDYVPTDADVLLTRVRTSGIVEEGYNIDGVTFRMFDVGGQRNERRKWIHCFEEVTAVIFVAAISEYNQVLYEDKDQNRMDEALALFNEIVNSRWFSKSGMILFLNKRDLLAEKIRRTPIQGCCGKYNDFPIDGPCTDENFDKYYAAAKKYWIQKFVEQKRKDVKKEIVYHVTCATDTENVSTVFNSCRQFILKHNLRDSGFIE